MQQYYYLKEGEIIQEGDEVEMSNDVHSPAKWVKTNCAGQAAPSPLYISHRKYRRLLIKYYLYDSRYLTAPQDAICYCVCESIDEAMEDKKDFPDAVIVKNYAGKEEIITV